MNKSILVLLLLGLIFPITYTKGTTKQRDVANAEESLDSADFWDFNPHGDSVASTVQAETITPKKSTVDNKKSTVNEIEQILKDMEEALSKMGATTTTERFLVQSSSFISSEEEILFSGENTEFELFIEEQAFLNPDENTEFDLFIEEEAFLIPDGNTDTDTQDEEEDQQGDNQEEDVLTETEAEVEIVLDNQNDDENEVPTETETPAEEVRESETDAETDIDDDEEEDGEQSTALTAFESKNDQAGTATLSGSVEYDLNFGNFDQQNGKATFINAITQALGVDSSLVRITNIREGSVIFDFEITLPAEEQIRLEDYATMLDDGVKDGTLDAFGDASILNFQRKVTVFAPITPTSQVTVPKDDSLVTVLVVVAGAVILAGIGFFVYKNKQAEIESKSMGKERKYQRSASGKSDAERLDLESRGTASRTAIGEEINDKLKLFAFSPPSDSSL